MKRFIINYLFLFLILSLCKFVFEIQFNDFVEIKYLLPNRLIYIMISILVNYIYLKISFQCIEQYLETNIFSLIRIGKIKLNQLLLKRSCTYITVFSLFSILIDNILYQNISIYGLIFTIVIELMVSGFIVVSHKKLQSNVLMVSLLFCLLLKTILYKF